MKISDKSEENHILGPTSKNVSQRREIELKDHTYIIRLVLLDGRGGALTLPKVACVGGNAEIASANDLMAPCQSDIQISSTLTRRTRMNVARNFAYDDASFKS